MSGDCDLLNDMSDIHDEQPEELRGEHPSEAQDDEQEESLHKTIEELTDGMKITNDNPITYGEYRAAENDPNHPLHDPVTHFMSSISRQRNHSGKLTPVLLVC